MALPLRAQSIQRAQLAKNASAKSVSVAAPVGGWNARDALGAMDKLDAVELENFFPSTTDVLLRYGFSNLVTGLGSQVETLMAYSGGITDTLFAATAGGLIRDVTTGDPGFNYVAITSVVGSYVSTPDSSAISITGDIDIRVFAAPDSWTTTGFFLDKQTGVSGYSFFLSATGGGTLRLTLGNGVGVDTAVSSVPVGLSDGQASWVRVTWAATTQVATFYTSSDGVTWTQLGATDTTTVSSIADDGGALYVGNLNSGNSPIVGEFYRAQVYDGINGTLAADMNPNDWTGTSTWNSTETGEAWTLNESSVVGSSISGLNSGRWQYANFTTSAGSYLCMVDGVDPYQVYNGTAWNQDGDGAPYDITGVNSEELIGINVFKNRLWFVQIGTLKAWYLPVNSIGGAAQALDMSSLCQMGGYLVAMGTWTIDAGYGVDDYAAWVTSNGEVLVWRMTDPTDPNSIFLVGVWRLGTPIGRRCFFKYAGDLLLICQDGVVPLSSALQSSRLNPKVSLTDKIQRAMSEAVALYGNNFGWQLEYFAKENQLYLNVPKTLGDQQQYVMNTITKNWGKFTGWDANCLVIFNDELHFGGNGFVGKAWDTFADDGADIEGFGLQAFSYWGGATSRKRVTMMRPTIYTDGMPDIGFGVNYDFDQSDRTTPAAFSATGAALWDSGVWDSATWGTSPTVQRNWQGTTGNGYAVAPSMSASANGVPVRWVATDMVIEAGGML